MNQLSSRAGSRRGTALIVAATAVWLATVSYGFASLWKYKLTAGATATAPETWPSGSQLVRSPDGATLIMLAHPRCPCTRASLRELDIAMNGARGRARAYVLFLKPSTTDENWAATDTWRAAARIPSTTVLLDVDGVQAARFGSTTSGHTLLYGYDGQLMFSGGLTFARGHEGESEGRAALVSLLRTGHSDRTMSAVFGCALQDPGTKTDGGRT